MQIDNRNYEVYTNNDLIAIHKPPSTFREIIILARSIKLNRKQLSIVLTLSGMKHPVSFKWNIIYFLSRINFSIFFF